MVLACICTFLHMHVCLCLCEYECCCTRHPNRQHMALLPPLWLVLRVSMQAGREGRPSLWLTQAERGFLHIFCHTIWALVSVAARFGPTWQLTVQTDICSFQPPGEQRKQQPTDPALLLSAYFTHILSVRTVTMF